jgi:hypothetical protein
MMNTPQWFLQSHIHSSSLPTTIHNEFLMWKIWRFVALAKQLDAHTWSFLNMLNRPCASCQKKIKHNLWIMTWSSVSFFLFKTNLESSQLIIMGSSQITVRFSTFITFNFLTYQQCSYERLGQTKNNKWPEQLPITSRFSSPLHSSSSNVVMTKLIPLNVSSLIS